MYKTIKYKVYDLLNEDGEHNILNNVIDYCIVIMIIFSSALVFLDSMGNLPTYYYQLFSQVETFFFVFFLVEYILRIWIANIPTEEQPKRTRLKFIFSLNGVIDFLALVPFFVPFIRHIDLRIFRVLRLLRLTRFMKINKYTRLLGEVFSRQSLQLLSSTFIVFILMLITGYLMYAVENEAQPAVFNNGFSGLWWAVSTLTTIGYGDIYPITSLGRFLAAVFSFLGICIVAIPTGIISVGFIEISRERRLSAKAEEKDMCYCPHCGERLKEDKIDESIFK